MEPQVTICCGRRSQKCCCLLRILYILIGLFTFVLGIILGAVFSTFILANIIYFVSIITVLAILAVITFIYIRCTCRD